MAYPEWWKEWLQQNYHKVKDIEPLESAKNNDTLLQNKGVIVFLALYNPTTFVNSELYANKVYLCKKNFNIFGKFTFSFLPLNLKYTATI